MRRHRSGRFAVATYHNCVDYREQRIDKAAALRTLPATMLAARLHGPRDLRVERVAHPGLPGRGDVLLRVAATGICGSDLHSFADARIGDTRVGAPLTLGHEFSGIVEAVGPGSLDGRFRPITAGTRVAVDPAQPCGRCESCDMGQPHLCPHMHFCGNYPDGGSLCGWMHMPARSCFPVPSTIDDIEAAMLEPLGVAIHAVDLAQIQVAQSLAIVGAGPIGLLILQVAKVAGADPIFVTDRLPWRLAVARRLGAVPINIDRDPAHRLHRDTGGRGVDVAIEAAWCDESVQAAAEMTRPGGRVVIVGIPGNDRLEIQASTARRKGLTLLMSRRMKHAYPRAIHLVEQGLVDVGALVSHRVPLRRAAEAFALNAAYRDKVVKVIVER
ncbi:MAG: alcohol dehydrogenase catalytic domain-containing protein [Vicinamibacterales bacterium]